MTDTTTRPAAETLTARNLCDHRTGETIRKATAAEAAASDAEVAKGRAEGVILVDGRRCYVDA